MKRTLTILTALLLATQMLFAQRLSWPENVKGERVRSSIDNTGQMVMFHATGSDEPRPLIVVMHGWGGAYKTITPLVKFIIDADWNFIQPNLHGPSNSPNSCGSATAMTDIADAIEFALAHGNVDMDEIHIVGVLNGGHNALAAYMTVDYPIKSVSAWAGVSDLEAWYRQIHNAKAYKYISFCDDMLSATGSREDDLNLKEFARRSPLKMKLPKCRRKTKLLLYSGHSDGKRNGGPVHPSQSVDMFNLVTAAFDKKNAVLISEDELKDAVNGVNVSFCGQTIGGREILLHKENKYAEMTIFRGGHEIFYDELFNRIPVNEKYR